MSRNKMFCFSYHLSNTTNVPIIYYYITVPDPPNSLKAIEIGHTYITLQWDIPWMFNGELDRFILKLEEMSAIDMETCCYSISPIELTIEEEVPTYNYTVILFNLI